MPARSGRSQAAVAAVALGVTALSAAPPPAAGASPCAAPAGVYREGPGWAQRLTAPERIWPVTEGTGQLVAVVGTGVDAGNPQFAPGQVVSGSDSGDCDGRGTIAAGIVAARPDAATTFTGMAPGVRVLAVRYTQATDGSAASEPDPDALAAAIGRSVAAGATVVLVVVPAPRSSPALQRAVSDALARGVSVVAPAVGDKPESRSYPAGLPGVVAVAATDQTGTPVQGESGDHLSLAAPGTGLVSTSAGTRGQLGHRWGVDNPAFAAAYVAGAVALVRAYRPALDPAQVLDRLTATASRPASGGRDPRLGWGVLDVYRAVTAEVVGEASARAGASPTTVEPAAGPATPPPRDRLPGALAVTGVLLAGAAVVGVAVIRRGRRTSPGR
ncbi:S8 family serine peptidase [Goodfellowiella coeruleoviolacea]|uniref:Subtilase family protein n=1 Tax=Goodfellowiella coeruleoviolacea TaxID=334858 RepID=A0AAE3KJZ1_9PSEU|nr:S8 family serine peptidase [Goodfellowiella coeruleoviolacea]MCP2170150.1 Subtilase family protein [Goodfellowiella coeruleoviolacea]